MGGQIVTGFSDMARRSDQRQASNDGGDFIRYINLRNDGDMVIFRLVTESDVQYGEQSNVPHLFIQGEFHREEGKSKGGKTFFRDVLCGQVYNEGTSSWEGECKFCGDPENKGRTQFFAWTYVYAFYHKQQDTRYIPGDESTAKYKRKQVRRGQEAYFKEDVNKFCIWQDGWFMLQLVQGKVARFGVLCDRDYMVTRHGVARSSSTRRVLDDLAPTVMADEIREGAADLPTLASVASNETRTMGGNSKPEHTVPDEVDLADLPEDELGTPVAGFSASEEDVDLFDALGDTSDSIFNETEDSHRQAMADADDVFSDLETMAAAGDVEEETDGKD